HTADTGTRPLSLHDALPILGEGIGPAVRSGLRAAQAITDGKPYRLDDVSSASVMSIGRSMLGRAAGAGVFSGRSPRMPGKHTGADRKSTRLNSSHDQISYAV